MCRRITCKNCSRPSFSGCGAHIEQVLGDVAPDDRCSCTAEEKSSARSGLLARLFGR